MYIEYFNILKESTSWDLFIALVIVLISIALYLFVRLRKSALLLVKVIPFLTLVGIVGLINLSYNSNKGYKVLKEALINKDHSSIEGIVTDFSPLDLSTSKPETFIVDGIKFSYADNIKTFGFNKSSTLGGPIREGQEVRIFYYKEIIIGLWIKE